MNNRPPTTLEHAESREEPAELRLSIDNVEIKVPLDETTKKETKDFLDELYRASAREDSLADEAKSSLEVVAVNDDSAEAAANSGLELGFKIEEDGGMGKEERKLAEDDLEGLELEGLTSTEISRLENFFFITI
jgi:hypothetical protein